MIVTSSQYTVGIDEITESEWSDLLPRFDDASIYQSWSYGAVCWGESQLSHLVLKSDGAVVAMTQVRIVRLPVIGKGIAYVRWGPLCRLRGGTLNEDVVRQLLLALKAEYVDRRGLMLRIIPNAYAGDAFTDIWKSAVEALGIRPDPAARVYRTMRVNLTSSVEDLRKGLQGRWRNYLKHAEKSGFTVVEGASDKLYDTFLALYRQMMARKQFDTTVDVEEFKRLQQALPDHLKMQVFVCERDGRALNAVVVSAIGESAIYLLAATGDEGLKERGAFLLQWRAMQWLKERGCRWYDVGGINPDKNPGVYQFKSGLGGSETFQLGRFEYSGDWVSSLCVGMGEGLQHAVRRTRTLLRRA